MNGSSQLRDEGEEVVLHVHSDEEDVIAFESDDGSDGVMEDEYGERMRRLDDDTGSRHLLSPYGKTDKRKTVFFGIGILALVLAVGLTVLLVSALSGGVGDDVYDDNLGVIYRKLDRFAPVNITANLTQLSEGDRAALPDLVAAARDVGLIFRSQIWKGNLDVSEFLENNQDSSYRQALLELYDLHEGPWDTLTTPEDDDRHMFIDIDMGISVPRQVPKGANFYPEDMTVAEFNAWLATQPAADREAARGFFTVLRRPDGASTGLQLVPYSEAYKTQLDRVANHLRQAGETVSDPTLRTFLDARAAAFSSNNYTQSDLEWMKVTSDISVTIGPYETYHDELFGYKAAFEAEIAIVDREETSKLEALKGNLQTLEDNLPEEPRFRNPNLGAGAVIRVVNTVFASGDLTQGVQTAAFNLPNDEVVTNLVGTKRIMLRNVQQAKYDAVLEPIARVVLVDAQADKIRFEAFFTHIIAHELSHGLGPQNATARQTLAEVYSAIEEAKADITGLWALQYMVDHQLPGADASLVDSYYITYLASSFRSVRFGLGEAHGKGQALQFNFLWDKGGIAYDEKARKFSIDLSKAKDAVTDLTRTLLNIEGRADKAAAVALLDKYALIRPEMQALLDQLADVPVDIAPVFNTTALA